MIPNIIAPSAPGGGAVTGLSQHRRERVLFHIGLGAVSLALAATLWSWQPFVFPLDDAYITLHNAQVLVSGRDDNYGVSALVGATSLIHLAAVAFLTPRLGPVPAGFLVSALSVAAYLQGLAALAFRSGASVKTAALIVTIGIGTGYTAYHLLNGLETGLALAAVTWAIVIATSPPSARLLPIICGWLPFVRPELAALGVALLARHMSLRWTSSQTRAEAWRLMVQDAALACTAAAPWILWSWSATGGLFPATAAAKQAFFAEADLPLTQKAFVVLLAVAAGGFGPIALSMIFMRANNLAFALWFFVASFLSIFLLTFPGGLHHNHFRYLYVILPVALYACCSLLADRRLALFKFFLRAGLAWSAFSVLLGPMTYHGARDWMLNEQVNLATWVNANLPPDATVLVHDAGHIAFATHLRLVDLVGLKTPDSIADHLRWTVPSHGVSRSQALDSIATRHRVSHAILLKDEDFWSSMAADLHHAGWTLEVLREPVGRVGYQVFRVIPPTSAN